MTHSLRRIMRCALGVSIGCILSLPAGAGIIHLNATMDCAQASAGAGTCGAGGTGTGTAALKYDDITSDLSWDVQWSGLSGTTTVAHFHGPASPIQNAGVQVDFYTLGGLSNPSAGNTTITAAQAADLLAGLWYVNIHSTSFPGGEIRGQFARVPEPSTTVLIVIGGLAALALFRRRKT